MKVINQAVAAIVKALEAEGFTMTVDYIIERYKSVGNAWLHGHKGTRAIEMEISELTYHGEDAYEVRHKHDEERDE